jgi:heme O synthase-like polyprenyltransferase
VTSALEAARRHPRHLVLFAVTAGLLIGPVAPAFVLVAAAVAAWLAGRPPLAVVAAVAVLAGAALAQARVAALTSGDDRPRDRHAGDPSRTRARPRERQRGRARAPRRSRGAARCGRRGRQRSRA